MRCKSRDNLSENVDKTYLSGDKLFRPALPDQDPLTRCIPALALASREFL